MMETGLKQMGRSLPAFASVGESGSTANHPLARGTADLLEGAGTFGAPFAVPAAVTSPVATVGALAGGYGGSRAGQALAEHFGASPETERAMGDVGAIPGGILGSKVAGMTSAAARPVMRNAMRLPSNESAEAVLENTTGARPETIGRQAGEEIGNAAARQRIAVGNATQQPSLAPARSSLDSAAQEMMSGNKSPDVLHPMIERLRLPAEDPTTGLSYPGAVNQGPAPAGLPNWTGELSEHQDPMDFLNIRRNFGKDFTKFDYARPLTKPALKAGNNAYMALTNELHRVAPGSAVEDELIHNLIPAKEQGELLGRQPGPIDQALARVGARTGAMTLPLAGYAFGGAPGAALATGAQSFLSDPVGRIVLARGLRGLSAPLPALPAATIGEKVGQ
jgi:hypothetical protein